MSNVELLRKYWTRAAEEPERFFALLAEDVVWDVRDTDSPMAGVYHGREAVRAFYRRWTGAFSEWGYDTERIVEQGEHVVTLVRERGRGRASGVETDMRRAQLWTFRDGRIVQFRSFSDFDAALAAAGQEPEA